MGNKQKIMSNSSVKLKQRAELISILGKYRDVCEIDNVGLMKDIKKISKMDNQVFVCKTLLQEINSAKTMYSNVCAIIILETINNDIFEKEALEFIKNKQTNDNKKLFIVSLMKQKGIDFNVRNIANYMESPEEFAHNGVVDFLENAIYDAEVQIDLLDFYLNIPNEEKIYFLESLIEEHSDDNIANAISIIVQLNPEKEVLDIILNKLLNSNSAYAIEGLDFILKNIKIDTKTRAKAKKKYKELTIKHADFVNDALIKDTKSIRSYISFVDGQSNFSMVFQRIKNDGLLDVLLCTINIEKGVISSMGFSAITPQNVNSVMKRLFSDSMPVEIDPIAFKSLFEYYYKKSGRNEIELPYELIVWKKILNGVKEINYDISEFLNSKLETINLTESKVKKFACAKVCETWYYAAGQNQYIDELFETLENNHIVDFEKINQMVSDCIDKNFINNKEFIADLHSKLLIQSYVASLAKLKLTSACAYSLCFDKKYLKILLESILDKSIYCELDLKLSDFEDKNVFKKHKKTNYSKAELKNIISQFEEKWN